MKKFLLLLSCCLATWCSVQAGMKSSASSSEIASAESRTMLLNSAMAAPSNASGIISSITYDSSTSKITINYKTTNASSASLNFLSIQKGGVINSSPISIPVSNYSYTTKTINIDTNWPESLFKVYLYVNGSVAGQISNGRVYPCYESQVTITVKGSIKVAPIYSDGILPVVYTLQHGSPYSSIKIYNEQNQQVYMKNVSNTNLNAFEKVTISKVLSAGKYTCRLYSNDKELDRKSFEVKGKPSSGETETWASAVRSITALGNNKIRVKFTVKDAGQNVALQVTAVPIPGGVTTYNYGRCEGHEGSCDISLPYPSGSVSYCAVVLLVNGQSVNGATGLVR